jgi:hypothetical protein
MALLIASLSVAASASQSVTYVPGIQGRWDISDLVCIGDASAPAPTGVIEVIGRTNRDQLSTDVELERCLKGEAPKSSTIRVFGDNVFAMSEVKGGYNYVGPPTGFVHEGRNLLFLRRTAVPNEFVVAIPVYQTVIPLADDPPSYPPAGSPGFTTTVVIRELESAMLQAAQGEQSVGQPYDEGLLSDIQYIDYLLDYMGRPSGVAELSRFSDSVPVALQQDIAILLFDNDQREYESQMISLLLDPTTPAGKRENAALALGWHGSETALEPLRKTASEPAGTDQQKQLRNAAESALRSLQQRLNSPQKQQ